jgi:hypothetical protein
MLARGTQPPVLGEVKVGVVVQLHLKRTHKIVTNPIIKSSKSKYINWYKAKMELFPKEFILELNTKNMGNSTRFLTITHTTLPFNRFRQYGILMIDIAVVFCF